MKVSSPYPVLDNRPIDQWKVTELKEELKRRKLITRGLKEDLIKRLDGAIREESESAMENADKGFDGTLQPVLQAGDAGTVSAVCETIGDMMNDGNKINEVDGGINHADAVKEGEVTGETDSARDEEMVFNDSYGETSVVVEDSVVSEVAVNVQESQNNDSQNVRGDKNSELEKEIKPPREANELNSSDPNIQVSEVSTVLGFQVKSDSISTDCVSINEKIELKDNIIADNVKLELDVKTEMVQPSSSNVFPDGGKLHPMDVEDPHEKKLPVEEEGNIHVANSEMSNKNFGADVVSSEKLNLDRTSGDDDLVEDDALESKQIVSNYNSDKVVDMEEKMEVSVVEEALADDMQDDMPVDDEDILEENINPPAALTVKRKIHDVVSSEKYNLDQSSGDNSMEEDDELESKSVIPKSSPDEVVDRKVKTEVPVVEAAAPAGDMQGDIAVDNEDSHDDTKNAPDAPTVKRMLHDQEVLGKDETPKRQRRWWNSENLRVPDPQSSIASSTTPKDVFPSTPLKRQFSRSNSGASDDAPKERVVPPSPKPPTNSLRIDHFLRPFTLKAVQALLGKTGTISSFWMDHIKTHCYVTYSSVEEAVETRNAVYNLQWPTNGGRLLVAEFVDPQEVKIRVEAPPQSPSTPVTPGPTIPPAAPTLQLQPQPSPRQVVQKEKLPPPPPLSNPPQARERLPLLPPPPLPEKLDPPIVTLDDLFKKTKATPCIYFLPLTDEQVAAKLKAQGNSTKQYAGVASRKELFWAMWCEISQLVDVLGFSRGLSRVEDEFKLGLKQLRLVSSSGQTEPWFLRVFLSSRGLSFGMGSVFPSKMWNLRIIFLVVYFCVIVESKLELLMKIKY
ncbi:uncharacterized protein LOC131298188 isoform X2 [Rhododendron vialii]|uniref:uncharacterized protein LOC131298188 isoform X2 n=1 Tax=Rhododendron vialii TaxID=182163 RepID=UPI00265E090A|nr:uncharacterized protein LOC131298188 isoform X2 [Rhododendron vialii]